MSEQSEAKTAGIPVAGMPPDHSSQERADQGRADQGRADQGRASALTGTTGAATGPAERSPRHEAAAAVADAIPPRCKARTRVSRAGHVAAERLPADAISQRLADHQDATA